MPTDVDPEGRETRELFAAAEFRGARVLELGCGAGRLTRRYADAARLVAGVDSDASALAAARAARPPNLWGRVAYFHGTAFELPFAGATFDVALFAWSL